jgi:hypothetical protein
MPDHALASRKKQELHAKRLALVGDLAHWRAASGQSAPGEPPTPYEKHHTQIARISARLERLLTSLDAGIDALADDAVLTTGQQVEEKLLAAHLVWDFFRSRLAMRGDAFLRTYLQACDEFAWSCYEPARTRFLDAQARRKPGDPGEPSVPSDAGGVGGAGGAGGEDVSRARTAGKEPPLVFLNGGWSPFAVSREQALDLDRPAFGVAGGAVAWLETGAFHGVVRELPFPMIGVPWYQVRHLPDALVLGHEMGHVLEWDFGLKADMESALARASITDDARRAAWSAWRREVFADVVGTLAGGPRFGGALMDFLATDRVKIQQEKRSAAAWGMYPMRWLRIELVASALDVTGFAQEAATLRADWQQAYGAPLAQQEFIDDVRIVVSALIAGPYTTLADAAGNGARLTDLVSFRKDAAGAPFDEAVVEAIFGQGSLDMANPREFFAAARLLYERDPAAFSQQDYNTRICELVIEHRMPGTRGTQAETLEEVIAADAASSDDWLLKPDAT